MAITELDPKLLVEAHNRGDDAAFATIVRTHHHGLFTHAVSRLHDVQAAEDAVQETFVRAYRAMPRFQGDFHLRAWLHRILTNVCHDEGSRRTRDGLLLQRVASQAEVGADPADAGIDRLDTSREVVAAALAALPASYREALVLRDVDELSYEEVAAATGVTEGNARVRVMRGRAALRRALTSSHAAIFGLVPFLRRGGRGPAAVADLQSLGSASASASVVGAPTLLASSPQLVASSPLLLRAVDTAPQLAERVATLPQLLGLVATMAVPIAAPVVGDQVASWVVRPPAAAAGPAVTDVAAAAPPEAAGAGPSTVEPVVPPQTETASSGEPVGGTTTSPSSDVAPTSSTVTTTGPTSTTSLPTTTSTTAGPAPTAPSSATPQAPTTSVPPTAPTPAAPAPVRASIGGDQLTSVGDQRTELAGAVRWTSRGPAVDGELHGVLDFDRAAPAPTDAGRPGEAKGDAPPARTFTGELTLALADGRTYRIVLTDGVHDDPASGTAIESAFELFDACDVSIATGTLGGDLDLQAAPVPSTLAFDLDGEGPATTPACD